MKRQEKAEEEEVIVRLDEKAPASEPGGRSQALTIAKEEERQCV